MKPVDVALRQQGALDTKENSLDGQSLINMSKIHPNLRHFDVSVKAIT
jgi:hypothetical protein